MKKKGFVCLALAGLFVLGVVAGGIVAPDLSDAYAQTTDFCEEDECESAPWWKFWASDKCVMSVGNPTGCDVIANGCWTYDCNNPPLPPGGGADGENVCDVGELFF